jgi:hypothetical protein
MNAWDYNYKKCEEYILKIKKSGWTQKFIIVGGNVGLGEPSAKGVSLGLVGDFDIDEIDFYMYANAVLEVHRDYGTWSIICADGESDGYDMGLNNGEILHHSTRHPETAELFQEIWTKSKNSTQWNKPNMQTKDVKNINRKQDTRSNKPLKVEIFEGSPNIQFFQSKKEKRKVVEDSPIIQCFQSKKEKRKVVDDSGSDSA